MAPLDDRLQLTTEKRKSAVTMMVMASETQVENWAVMRVGVYAYMSKSNSVVLKACRCSQGKGQARRMRGRLQAGRAASQVLEQCASWPQAHTATAQCASK